MGYLLSIVGEDTTLELDPTPACPAWEVWGDPHHGMLRDDDSTVFFSVFSFFQLAGHCWIKEEPVLSDRQVSQP